MRKKTLQEFFKGKSSRKNICRKGRQGDLADAPLKERMRPNDIWPEPSNKRWGLVMNFLLSRLDKPWADVWQEVCRECDTRSYHGLAFRKVVQSFVYWKDIYEKDGELFSSRIGKLVDYSYRMWPIIYVDLEGILRRLPYRPRQSTKPVPKIVRKEGKEFFKSKGVWYEVKSARFSTRSGPRLFDMFLHETGCFLEDSQVISFYGESVLCTYKRQISQREKRLYKLEPGD